MRRFLVVVLGILLALGGGAWYLVTRIEVEPVSPAVSMMTGIGGNVGVLVTPEGVVVVDTMTFVRQGDAIRARIRELTDRPIAAVINTHYHIDHTHGNPAFPPGTPVVATARTLHHLRELDGPFWRDAPARDLLPNATFESSEERRVGGKTIRSLHLGRGHTDGDLVVLFVEDRVLHAGDLVWNGHYPNIDLEAGGSVHEWVTTLDRVLALPFDRVIPGHGPVTDRDGVVRFREFLKVLWDKTKLYADRGASVEQAIELVKVDIDRFRLEALWFAPTMDAAFVVRRTYQEVMSAPRGRGS